MENPASPSDASEHDYRCVSGLLSRAGDKCRPRTRSGAGALGLHDCEPSALPAATYFLKPCCRISRDRATSTVFQRAGMHSAISACLSLSGPPVFFDAFFSATFFARPRAAPFYSDPVLPKRGHETGIKRLDLHFGDLTRIGANDCLAIAVTTIGVNNHGGNDEIKAKCDSPAMSSNRRYMFYLRSIVSCA